MVNYSPTLSSDCAIRCTNKKCKSHICTLSRCYKSFLTRAGIVLHQDNAHRKNADPNRCYFCKAEKDRSGKSEIGQCPDCGMHWCLFKQCTFEALELSRLTIHQSRTHHKDG